GGRPRLGRCPRRGLVSPRGSPAPRARPPRPVGPGRLLGRADGGGRARRGLRPGDRPHVLPRVDGPPRRRRRTAHPSRGRWPSGRPGPGVGRPPRDLLLPAEPPAPGPGRLDRRDGRGPPDAGPGKRPALARDQLASSATPG